MSGDRKIMGNVFVKLDGQLMKCVPDSVTLNFGGYPRESKSADGSILFQDKPVMASKLVCKFYVTKATSVDKINNIENGMAEVITDIGGGITYAIVGATRTGDPVEINSGDGTASFQCEGEPIAAA